MKGTKEQESKLSTSLWTQIILVFIVWVAVISVGLYFLLRPTTPSVISPKSSVPDLNVDQADKLRISLNEDFQSPPSTITTGRPEPFD